MGNEERGIVIVYNLTDKEFQCQFMRKDNLTHRKYLTYSLILPGNGLCGDAYPRQAKQLEDHNKKYRGDGIMNVNKGKYGFVKIREGHYKDDIGFYMEDVEDDMENNQRAHVAVIKKSKTIITRISNLQWLENQEELQKEFEPQREDER